MLFSSALCLVVWQLAIPQMAHVTHVTNLQHILLVMNHYDESIERRICLRYASSLTQKNTCSHLPNATLVEQISTKDMYLTLEQQLLSSMIHHCLRPLKDTTPVYECKSLISHLSMWNLLAPLSSACLIEMEISTHSCCPMCTTHHTSLQTSCRWMKCGDNIEFPRILLAIHISIGGVFNCPLNEVLTENIRSTHSAHRQQQHCQQRYGTSVSCMSATRPSSACSAALRCKAAMIQQRVTLVCEGVPRNYHLVIRRVDHVLTRLSANLTASRHSVSALHQTYAIWKYLESMGRSMQSYSMTQLQNMQWYTASKIRHARRCLQRFSNSWSNINSSCLTELASFGQTTEVSIRMLTWINSVKRSASVEHGPFHIHLHRTRTLNVLGEWHCGRCEQQLLHRVHRHDTGHMQSNMRSWCIIYWPMINVYHHISECMVKITTILDYECYFHYAITWCCHVYHV